MRYRGGECAARQRCAPMNLVPVTATAWCHSGLLLVDAVRHNMNSQKYPYFCFEPTFITIIWRRQKGRESETVPEGYLLSFCRYGDSTYLSVTEGAVPARILCRGLRGPAGGTSKLRDLWQRMGDLQRSSTCWYRSLKKRHILLD